MSKKIRQFVAGMLAVVHCICCVAAFVSVGGAASAASPDPYADLKMRVGLAYEGSALGAQVGSNLWTEDGYTPGFRFGYYDGNLNFVQLGYTNQGKITMTKTKNIYLVGNTFYDELWSGNYRALGCYHLQMSTKFSSYDAAKTAAARYQGGFVAWKDGSYYVRANAYTTPDAAWTGAGKYGDGTWSVVHPSSYAVNVVVYGTTEIIFQFDGGMSLSLGVKFGLSDAEQTRAWFNGYRYYGGMRYQRLKGDNMTVVNIVPLITYVKGVVPYESNKLWPLETLKAQAMCAKNYALTDLGKHEGHKFDVCNTSDCQVYRGYGNERNQPNALSDQAVDDTKGLYVWYKGKLAKTFFCSSNGGGTESVVNVWGGTTYPYLTGVIDPYEADIADVATNYHWTKTFTKEELTEILHDRGYATGTSVVGFGVTKYSNTGNVLEMTFEYANGKSDVFVTNKSSWLRSKLGCRSLHFAVSGSGQEMPQGIAVNDGTGAPIESFVGLIAIGAKGIIAQITEKVPYVIVGGGEVTSALGGPTVIPSNTYVITGTGWGHNIGFSQWGGYAMALRGYKFDEILRFYYPGVTVGAKG